MRPALCLILLLLTTVADAQARRKPRVFVSDSNSWEQSASVLANAQGAVGSSSGGARPQTAEIIKTLSERCPNVTVTLRQDRADYVLLIEHEGGKGLLRRDNKFVVFNKDGDAFRSGSTKTIGSSVKDACAAILGDWPTKEPDAKASENPSRPLTSSPEPLESKADNFPAHHPVSQLQSPNEKDRYRAAKALGSGRIPAEHAVPALVSAVLNDDKWTVRAAAAASLGSFPSRAQDGVPALIRALSDEDREVRREAARAIVSIGPSAIPALEEAVKSSDGPARREVAKLLSKIAQKDGKVQ